MERTEAEKSSKNNLKYPKESAGRIMTNAVPIVLDSFTLGEAESLILQKINEFETINYLYAVDKDGRLKGVVSIREVFRHPKEKRIFEVMEEKIVHVGAYSDQEKIVALALKHGLKAIPVISKGRKFLGVVPYDIILKVAHLEHSEDILYGAGVLEVNSPEGIIQDKKSKILKARLPWLLLGLLGGILSAFVIERFEDLLMEKLVLALFVPVVVYMSDAVGAQTQTIFIRAMAINHSFSMKQYLKKEFSVGLLISFILAGLLGLVVWPWFGFPIALVVSLSMLFTIFIAVIVGLITPIAFLFLKKDTAVGSGPFSTILSDVISIAVYFSISYLLLGFL